MTEKQVAPLHTHVVDRGASGSHPVDRLHRLLAGGEPTADRPFTFRGVCPGHEPDAQP